MAGSIFSVKARLNRAQDVHASHDWAALTFGSGASAHVGSPQQTNTTISNPAMHASVAISGGTIDAMVNQAIAKLEPVWRNQLSDALHQSLMGSGGFAGGSNSSPYTIGGS